MGKPVGILVGFNLSTVILPEAGLRILRYPLVIHIYRSNNLTVNRNINGNALLGLHYRPVNLNQEGEASIRSAVVFGIFGVRDGNSLGASVKMRIRHNESVIVFDWNIFVLGRFQGIRKLNDGIVSLTYRLPGKRQLHL